MYYIYFLQLTTDIETVLKSCANQGADSKPLEERMSKMSSMSESARLSSLLHLLCLLFEVSIDINLKRVLSGLQAFNY